MIPTGLPRPPLLRGLALVLPAVLLLASSALAAEVDTFQLLLQHTGLPESSYLPPGQALTKERAQALWRGLVDSPATLRTFAPRTALALLLREAPSSGQPLPYSELRARSARLRRLVMARPDGYVTSVLTGKPLAHLSRPTLRQGELYAQGLRIGAFHFDDSGVFYAVDASWQKHGPPVGELPLGRDPVTAALLGTEDALGEMAQALASLFTHPVRSLEDMAQLPSAVAGLIASSPDYFSRYGAMNLEDQIREASRLATHVLTLLGGSATVGPRLSSASRLPVLSVSAQGSLRVRELALSAGTSTVVVAEGAASASIVLLAQGSNLGTGDEPHSPWPPPPEGPGQWTQANEGMPEHSQRYQTQITGAPEGWVYRIRTGPKDHVDYDGFKNGVLLEAKGPGYRELLRKMGDKSWFEGVDNMLKQAQNQFKAAQGTPIEWHFAEQEVADLVRKLFKKNGLSKIKVVHTQRSHE